MNNNEINGLDVTNNRRANGLGLHGRLLVVVASLGLSMLANAQWVAFNDFAVHPANDTDYTLQGAGGTNAGPLTNVITGAALPAYMTITNGTTLSTGTSMLAPNPGTPAYDIFNANVDWTGYPGADGTQPAVHLFSNNIVGYVFTGLNISKTYKFAATGIRGGAPDGGTGNWYSNRWTRADLVGAVSFTAAHTAGVLTSNQFPTFLAVNQAALNTGVNVNGDVIEWDNIIPTPGPGSPPTNGTFTVITSEYTNGIPGAPDGLTPVPIYTYTLGQVRLEEVSSTLGVILINPTNGAAFSFCVPILASAIVGGFPTNVTYFVDGNPVAILTAAPFSPVTLPQLSAGSHSIYVTARDATNHFATTLTNTFSVNVNQAPTIAITNTYGLGGVGTVQLVGTCVTNQLKVSDPDGTVTNVDWYENGLLRVRIPTGYNQTTNLCNDVLAGTTILTAVAFDNCGAMSTSAPVVLTITNPPTTYANVLFTNGSDWKYFSQNNAPPNDGSGNMWFQASYNDASWAHGPGNLGWGGTWQQDAAATVMNYPERTAIADTGPLTNRYPTLYFRSSFNVSNPALYTNLIINLLRDDGAVVWLNGRPVVVNNITVPYDLTLPGNDAMFNTNWAGNANNDNGTYYWATRVAGTNLVQGLNVLCAEVHQQTNTSHDIQFDAMVWGQVGSPTIFVGPQPVTIPCGSNATFAITVTGSPQLRYQWYFGSTPIPTGTNATLAITNAMVSQSGGYYVVVTNVLGAATSSVASLTVNCVGTCLDTYTITLWPGTNVIANQLDNGGNTLAEVLPVVPDGAQLRKWDPIGQTYSAAATFHAGTGWDTPSTTLQPGEGAFLVVSVQYNLTFNGIRRCAATLPLCPVVGYQLVSDQIPETGIFGSAYTNNLLGLALVANTKVIKLNPQTQTTNTYLFNGTTWSPAQPTAAIGEAVWLYWPIQSLLQITCPTDQTVPAGAGLCSAIVSVGQATASGGYVPWTITGVRSDSLPLANPYPVGVTRIAWTASDGCKTVVCTQLVTVLDAQPPAFAGCPANIVKTNDAGVCSAVVSWTEPTVSDNCGVVATNRNIAPGATFPFGINTVTYTAVDASGNTGTCTFTVTVNAQAPVATWRTTPILLTASANCQVSLPDLTTTNYVTTADPCYTLALTQSIPANTVLGVRSTNQVVLTVSDGHGQITYLTNTLIAVDKTPPTLTCPQPQTLVISSGCQTALPDLTGSATAQELCSPPASLSQSPAAGTVFAIGAHNVTITATDAAGNSSTCVVVVTVKETVPPTIVCPADVTTNAQGTSCYQQIKLGVPTTGDSCGVSTVASNAPFSMPVGTNYVLWTVTDTSGNTASCTQRVIVTCPGTPCVDIFKITNTAPGWIMIGNQVDNKTANTLMNIFTSLPDGSMFKKWDAATQTVTPVATFHTGSGWDNPTMTFSAGEGAMLYLNTARVVNLGGARRCWANLPLNLVQGDQWVADQMPRAGTFESIVGLAPIAGTKVMRWSTNLQAWVTNAFDGTSWSLGAPVSAYAEGWRLYWPASVQPKMTLKAIAQGTDGVHQIITITGDGTPTSSFWLQRAPEVRSTGTPWTNWMQRTAGSDRQVIFYDTNPPSPSFYRAAP